MKSDASGFFVIKWRRGIRQGHAVTLQFRHPDYLKAIDRIVAACESHGKTAAFLATDDDWARDYAAKGFRLMGYGIDQAMLQRALANGLGVLRGAMTARGKR